MDIDWIALDVDCIGFEVAYFYLIALDCGLQTTMKRSPKRSPKHSHPRAVSRGEGLLASPTGLAVSENAFPYGVVHRIR